MWRLLLMVCGITLAPACGNATTKRTLSPEQTVASIDKTSLIDGIRYNRQSTCLALAIYQEARGESRRGQLAIGHVILNRVKNNNLTICETLWEDHGRQFPWVRKSVAALQPREVVWLNVQATTVSLLSSPQPDITNGATYFFNPHACHCRLPGTVTAVIDSHTFVRKDGNEKRKTHT